jgi:HSP20 family protein
MALVRRDRSGLELPELWRRFFDGDPEAGWLRVEELRDGDDLVVRSELPGVDPDRDVELSVADGVLHISARRQERSEEKNKNVYRSEFRYGSFFRNVALPRGVDGDDVKATYRDGILEVRVPLGAEPMPVATKIPIRRTSQDGRP